MGDVHVLLGSLKNSIFASEMQSALWPSLPQTRKEAIIVRITVPKQDRTHQQVNGNSHRNIPVLQHNIPPSVLLSTTVCCDNVCVWCPKEMKKGRPPSTCTIVIAARGWYPARSVSKVCFAESEIRYNNVRHWMLLRDVSETISWSLLDRITDFLEVNMFILRCTGLRNFQLKTEKKAHQEVLRQISNNQRIIYFPLDDSSTDRMSSPYRWSYVRITTYTMSSTDSRLLIRAAYPLGYTTRDTAVMQV